MLRPPREPAIAVELPVPSAVPKSQGPESGTVLAFDFGAKRTGVAVGQFEVGLAHPLATIAEESGARRLSAVAALIAQWKPRLLLVGVPVHADGGEHEMTRRARRFAHLLHARFGIPTESVDERFTSSAAAETLRSLGVGARKHKPLLDRVAAQHMLQAFFDARRDGSS